MFAVEREAFYEKNRREEAQLTSEHCASTHSLVEKSCAVLFILKKYNLLLAKRATDDDDEFLIVEHWQVFEPWGFRHMFEDSSSSA